MAVPSSDDSLFYPESDGQPVAETEFHLLEMMYAIGALRERYAAAGDVYVGGNLFLYYQEGNREAVVAPDVFVVKGVPKLPPRRKYLLWEERTAPCFVLELTSESTLEDDTHDKKEVYERLGVQEYFLFDPLGEDLDPPLQGFRLVRGRYRPIPLPPDDRLMSTTLGLVLQLEGGRLRLVDAVTGEPLLRHDEIVTLRRQAESVAMAEAARTNRESANAAAARADREAAQRKAEAARAEREAEGRRLAEERVRVLEEALARLRTGD